MLRLYKKSELWFALAWIIIYVTGASVADSLSDIIGLQKSVTLIFLGILCTVALLWLNKNGLLKKYGLIKSPIPSSKFLYYIPLAILISCNLWHGAALNLSLSETVFYILSMLCVGFLEELIFRGFLFEAMRKNGTVSAIIVSSVTFGIGHIVNLFNGSGAQLIANICQVCYAIAFGFLCVILFYRGKSLLPCITTHSLFNALSVFANEANITDVNQIVISAAVCIICITYTLILHKTLPRPASK